MEKYAVRRKGGSGLRRSVLSDFEENARREAERAPEAPRQEGKHQKREHGRKLSVRGVVALCVGGALLLAILAGGAYLLWGYSRVYPGVSVCGTELSRLDRQAAGEKLTAVLGELNKGRELTVTIRDQDYPVTTEDSGISYDADATLAAVMNYGRTGGLGARLRAVLSAWRKGAAVEPVTTLDEALLRARVQEIAAAVAVAVRQPSWSREGDTLTVDKGAEGYAVDQDALFTLVRDRLEQGKYDKTAFEISAVAPNKLTAADVVAAVQQEVQEPTLDLKADPSGGTLVSGKPGVTVDQDALQKLLDSTETKGTMKLTLTQPKYSDEEYRSLLFRDELARGKTSFNADNVGRTTNVLLATEACDGVVLLPGDTFSYNDTVGPRTYERGFKDAIVYVGTSAEAGVGGGICQVSSTLYYTVLRADLKIVERHAHSRIVTYVPLGEDATVAWGSKDFKFRNDTDFPIRVETSHTRSTLTVRIVGTQTVAGKEIKMDTTVLSKNPFEVVYETDKTLPVGTTKVKSNGYTGYVTETYRVVYVNGKEVSRTFENKSTYTRYDKVILENPAPATTTPTEPATTPTEPTTTPTEPATTPTEPATTPVTPAA